MISEGVFDANPRLVAPWDGLGRLGSRTGGGGVAGEGVFGGFGGGDVALGGGDADAEEVAESAGVTVGGEGFVKDAVLSDGAGWEADLEGDPVGGDAAGASGAAGVDEQVGVDAVGPASGAFGEPGVESCADGLGEGELVVADGEGPVAEVDELQPAEVVGAQGVERDEGGQRGACGVGAVEWKSLIVFFVPCRPGATPVRGCS